MTLTYNIIERHIIYGRWRAYMSNKIMCARRRTLPGFPWPDMTRETQNATGGGGTAFHWPDNVGGRRITTEYTEATCEAGSAPLALVWHFKLRQSSADWLAIATQLVQ
jgi:hypothetical protein